MFKEWLLKENFEQQSWFQILKPQEQERIRVGLSEKAERLDPKFWAETKFFVQTLQALEELMPFPYDNRLSFSSWWREAKEQGLINFPDEHRLVRYCIDQLYF